MCLAIPGRVEEITTDGLIRVGRVNFGGVVKSVCLDCVPDVEVGDYTIVHVGFAISKIDEKTGQQGGPSRLARMEVVSKLAELAPLARRSRS
jgi:hydrogenase expression/formation protein HypC